MYKAANNKFLLTKDQLRKKLRVFAKKKKNFTALHHTNGMNSTSGNFLPKSFVVLRRLPKAFEEDYVVLCRHIRQKSVYVQCTIKTKQLPKCHFFGWISLVLSISLQQQQQLFFFVQVQNKKKKNAKKLHFWIQTICNHIWSSTRWQCFNCIFCINLTHQVWILQVFFIKK